MGSFLEWLLIRFLFIGLLVLRFLSELDDNREPFSILVKVDSVEGYFILFFTPAIEEYLIFLA